MTPTFTCRSTCRRIALSALLGGALLPAWGHGDVTPQSVDTKSLPALGADWKTENPHRENAEAVKVGSSAYNQNCARCHGLEAISGGIAPDLRKLDNDCVRQKGPKQLACRAEMDEYYSGSLRRGKVRNGAVYMPPLEGILNREATRAIKAYLETRREQLDTRWKDGTEAAKPLQRGEVAAAAGMASELESVIGKDARFVIDPLPLPRMRNGWAVGMAVKKDAIDLAQALQAAVNRLGESGEIGQIFARSQVDWHKP